MLASSLGSTPKFQHVWFGNASPHQQATLATPADCPTIQLNSVTIYSEMEPDSHFPTRMLKSQPPIPAPLYTQTHNFKCQLQAKINIFPSNTIIPPRIDGSIFFLANDFYFFHYTWFTVFCQYSPVQQGDPATHPCTHSFFLIFSRSIISDEIEFPVPYSRISKFYLFS